MSFEDACFADRDDGVLLLVRSTRELVMHIDCRWMPLRLPYLARDALKPVTASELRGRIAESRRVEDERPQVP